MTASSTTWTSRVINDGISRRSFLNIGTLAAMGTAGGWPQFGSMVSRVLGSATPTAPPFVSLCYPCTHGPYNEPGPGFLGAAHAPFRPLGSTKHDMVLNGVSLERLADRASLLRSVVVLRRDLDATMTISGIDRCTQQAMGLLTSSRLAEALDLSKEDPRIVEHYGTGDPTIFMDGNGAPRVPQSLRVARRLIEAGVSKMNPASLSKSGTYLPDDRRRRSPPARVSQQAPSGPHQSGPHQKKWSRAQVRRRGICRSRPRLPYGNPTALIELKYLDSEGPTVTLASGVARLIGDGLIQRSISLNVVDTPVFCIRPTI
jgi:hypothetical protein